MFEMKTRTLKGQTEFWSERLKAWFPIERLQVMTIAMANPRTLPWSVTPPAEIAIVN